MNLDFATEMFAGLSDEHLPIGGVYQVGEGLSVVPFVCKGHEFLAIYQPLMELDHLAHSIREVIYQDSTHTMSKHAHIVKFASLAQYANGQNFVPLPAASVVKKQILHMAPRRIAAATEAFMEQQPHADEFYFVAGGEDDERIRKLNLWYQRVADRIAAQSLSLQRIHPQQGNWYGYRKVNR